MPGLVLALDRPRIAWTFVESNLRRAVWLGQAIEWLGLSNVVVRNERAEETGRSGLRGTADLVTARSFAAPAITAECAAPLLRLGGLLWVSQPPTPDPGRWPPAGLAQLGLRPVDNGVRSWAAFVAETPCGARYPRRVGIPGKRPLF